MDSFGGLDATSEVEVDLITDAYRITGLTRTRFGRVTDIVNQLPGQHLTVEQATISEHADPGAPLAAPSALVDVSSILLLAAPGLTGDGELGDAHSEACGEGDARAPAASASRERSTCRWGAARSMGC